MSLSDVFKTSCEKIYGNVNNLQECPDQYVMYIDLQYQKPIIDIICSNKTQRSSKYISNISNQDAQVVVIILESPHINEFDQNGAPIGPAMGKTGENISNYILNVLKKHYSDGKYKIMLMEAVSYQCSNGEPKINGQKRDTVFKDVWVNGGEDDFKVRLKSYHPDIVINACTGGVRKIDSQSTLNSLVDSAVRKLGFKNYYYSSHPSSYWFGIKRMIKRCSCKGGG